MKDIALYGYGVFGKRCAESFRFFWGGEYRVTAVFDRDRAGEEDGYWALTVLNPDRLPGEYEKGLFEAVMVCIGDGETRAGIRDQLAALGIPVFLPGRAEDFAESGAFPEAAAPELSFRRDGYTLRVCRDLCGAVADFERRQFVFLFDESGRQNIDSYRAYREVFEPLLRMIPFRFRDPLPEKLRLEGSWCVIARPYSRNYWHFTFETLDCVWLLEAAGYRGKYLFDDVPFARELLNIMGVTPDRLVGTRELELHKVYVFEKLVDPERTGLAKMECSAGVIREMAAFFRAKLARDAQLPGRIYVKRIGRRQLLNGDELAVRNGFTVIVPEEYGVREQMALFYNADLVLCPHGANSTNCLYMREGAVFAELFSDRWAVAVNEAVCAANGVHYLQLVGQARAEGRDIEADYTVDGDAFRRLILTAEALLGNGGAQADAAPPP